MSMRLLTKREVDVAKNKDRQMAVAEGLKLATRVDNLREVAAKEDVALQKFRIETLSAIHGETSQARDVLDSLLHEVAALEERKAIAIAPLDVKKAELDSREKVVAAQEAKNADVMVAQHANANWLGDREDTLNIKEERARVVHTNARALMDEASIMKDEAVQVKADADKLLSDSKTKSAQLLIDVKQRELWVKEREDAVFIREEENRKEKITIAQRWSELKDRQATHERNLKRK